MGILNITPDSFSGDGLLKGRTPSEVPRLALELATQMVEAGARIIDVGGESSRPGAVSISEQEELNRVVAVVRILAKELKVPISVDTTRANVAEAALKEGAVVINDITGLRGDWRMSQVIVDHQASCIIMHMQGRPQTMQQNPFYHDVVREIMDFFRERLEFSDSAGISQERIILDPGIGFGKSVDHNLEILRSLDQLKALGYPILVGTSRKSVIAKLLEKRAVHERLFGTAATVALAIAKGADFIRVHDVAQMKDVARIADAIIRNRVGSH